MKVNISMKKLPRATIRIKDNPKSKPTVKIMPRGKSAC